MSKYPNVPRERLAQIDAYNRRIRTAVQEGETMRAIGTRVERRQSDKIGFDLISYYIGDQLMRSEYAAQENPQGTADNPIPWNEDAILIPNAYYTLDGVRKVWTGESGAQNVTWTDYRWEVW